MKGRGTLALLCVLIIVSAPVALPAMPSIKSNGQIITIQSATPRSLVHEEGGDVVLENDFLTLRFNKTSGGLLSVFDPVKGTEFRPDKDMPPVLFQVVMKELTGGAKLTLTDVSATNITFVGSQTQGAAGISFTYKEMAGTGVEVVAHIEVRDLDPRSYWDIQVFNSNSSISVNEVRYPIVHGVSSDIGTNGMPDMLALPKLDGMVISDPYPKTQPPFSGNFRYRYPGELSMQFMALYDPDVAGIYLDAQDNDGNIKEFFMENQGPANNVMVGISHFRPDVGAVGTGLMYQCSMAVFHGDWYQAADLYKDWALQQDWASKGKMSQRTDVPDWWLSPSPMVVIERRDISGTDKVYLEQWSDVVASFKALTGENVTLKVLGWEKNGSYAGPFYLPAKDGDPEVSTEVKEVLVAGGHVMFSTSESLWRLSIPSSGYDSSAFFNTYGKPWAVMNMSGETAQDPESVHQGIPAAVMDPTTKYWQDLQYSVSAGIANDIVDIQELGDLPYGAWVPCYSTSHGHAEGAGQYISDGYLKIVGDSFTAGRDLNPDFMLTIDGPSELFIGKVQSYRSSSNSPERTIFLYDMNRFHDDFSTAPMFSYIFHQYTSTYSTSVPVGSSDIISQYNSSARSIAKAFVDGQLPSVMATGTNTGNQRLTTLYSRSAKALGTFGRDYMFLGEMLAPPMGQSPLLDVPYRVDPREGQDWAGWATVKEPQVLSSAWRNNAGTRVALALVNWGNTSADVDLNIPRYGLPDDNYTLVMDRNGVQSTLMSSTPLPVSLGLSLGSRDVVVIEVLHGPDLVLEDFRADETSPILGATVNLTVEVANRGSMVANNIHVTLFENGSYIDDMSVGQMGPDMNATFNFTWPTEGKSIGTYNLTTKVWPVIGEIIGNNNELSLTINVMAIPNGAIRCTVIDNSTKTPMSGVNVKLFDPKDGSLVQQVVTGISNDAVFLNLLPGTYWLNASHTGYYPAENNNVTVLPGKTTLSTLALVPVPVVVTDGDLTGLVLDNSTRTPISNAKVFLVQPDLTYYTDASGVYLFTAVEAGVYDMVVTRADYQGTNLKVAISAKNLTYLNITLVLIPVPPKVGDLVGTVLEKTVLTPIPGALVRLSGGDIEPMELTSNPVGGFGFPELQFGSYVLNVTANGYFSAEISAEVTKEGANEVRVLMTAMPVPPAPTVTIMGFVMDTKGKPLFAAQIRLTGQSPPPAVYSDKSGLYEIKDIKPGSYGVLAELDGYSAVTLSVNASKAGTFWLNITMKQRSSTTTAVGDVGTYIMVGLLVLMLFGIIVMLVTGKGRDDGKERSRKSPSQSGQVKKGRVPRKVKVVTVKKLSSNRPKKDEEE